jgi:hypothetical protein
MRDVSSTVTDSTVKASAVKQFSGDLEPHGRDLACELAQDKTMHLNEFHQPSLNLWKEPIEKNTHNDKNYILAPLECFQHVL